MTNESNEKQKRDMTPLRKTWQGYVALGLAAGLWFLMIHIIGLAQSMPVFYPLLLLTQYPPLQVFLWGTAAVFFVGLMIFAVKRRIWSPTLLVFLIGGGLLLIGFLYGTGLNHVMSYQTLSHQDHVYHLITKWEHSFDWPSSSERYKILKCDSMGLICDEHSTPYSVELTDYAGNIVGTFDTSGKLLIDEVDQRLKLRVGDEVYPINAYER